MKGELRFRCQYLRGFVRIPLSPTKVSDNIPTIRQQTNITAFKRLTAYSVV